MKIYKKKKINLRKKELFFIIIKMKINKTKIMKYAKKNTQTFFDSSVISLPHTSFESEENVLCRTESDVKTNKN